MAAPRRPHILAGASKHFVKWHGVLSIIVNGHMYALDLGSHYVTPGFAAANYCMNNRSRWARC